MDSHPGLISHTVRMLATTIRERNLHLTCFCLECKGSDDWENAKKQRTVLDLQRVQRGFLRIFQKGCHLICTGTGLPADRSESCLRAGP